jgi:hypothetical protein
MLRFVAFLVSVPFLLAQPVPGHYIVELTGPAAAARPARQSLRRALAAQAVEVLDSVDHVANALLVRVRENS